MRRKGVGFVGKSICERLKGCDLVYVSFDIDALDGRLVKGTGTPVNKGFEKDEMMGLLSVLLKGLPVKVFEITELNPLLDDKNKTAELVFEILLACIKDLK